MSDFSNLKNQKAAVGKKTNADKVKAFKELLEKYPELEKLLFSWSDYIKVVNTCGFGETGGLIQIQPAEKRINEQGKSEAIPGTRKVEQTSQIVGYVLKNISENINMEYETEEYYLDKNNELAKNRVKKILAPGQTCMLTRKFTTKFCSRPEISFKLANATVSRVNSSSQLSDSVLEQAYIRLTEKGVAVHDPDFKINIAVKVGEVLLNKKLVNTYKVMPEYFSTFGYLDYIEPKTNRNRRATIDNMDHALAAHYVYSLREKNNKDAE